MQPLNKLGGFSKALLLWAQLISENNYGIKSTTNKAIKVSNNPVKENFKQ